MFHRAHQDLENYLEPGKVLLLYGPRQAGKTTLVRQFLERTQQKYKFDIGDNIRTRELFSAQDLPSLLAYAEGYQLLVIDEAQQIPHIGRALKMLVDARPDLRIIATGSSSFDLANEVGEPLTGRKRTLLLYPMAQCELLHQHNRSELRQHLEQYLLYGTYPAIVTAASHTTRREKVQELADAYLLKDVLAFERLKKPRVLLDVLKLLAFQIGQLVSHHELATQLSVNTKTIQRYLDLLTKAFVITALPGFSRHPRKEVTSQQKYYFYDLGIRNAVIAAFNPLRLRNDIGQLWENFVIVERLKYRTYTARYGNAFFWRSYSQQEVDLIEERDEALFGYECVWNPKAKKSAPAEWKRLYPKATFHVISPDNYLEFVAAKS